MLYFQHYKYLMLHVPRISRLEIFDITMYLSSFDKMSFQYKCCYPNLGQAVWQPIRLTNGLSLCSSGCGLLTRAAGCQIFCLSLAQSLFLNQPRNANLLIKQMQCTSVACSSLQSGMRAGHLTFRVNIRPLITLPAARKQLLAHWVLCITKQIFFPPAHSSLHVKSLHTLNMKGDTENSVRFHFKKLCLDTEDHPVINGYCTRASFSGMK